MSATTNRMTGKLARGVVLALAIGTLPMLLVGAMTRAGDASAAQATPTVEAEEDGARPGRGRLGAAAARCERRLELGSLAEERLDSALTDLVAEGVLNEAQAEAVRERLTAPSADPDEADAAASPVADDRRPGLGLGLPGPCARIMWVQETVETVAGIVGIEPEELVDRLTTGESLSDIAESEGVSREDLIAALEAEIDARLDAAVEAGLITTEERADLEPRLTDRLDELVDRRRGGGLDPAGEIATPDATA